MTRQPVTLAARDADPDAYQALFGAGKPLQEPFTLTALMVPLSWNKVLTMNYHTRSRAFAAYKDAVAIAWNMLEHKPDPFTTPVEIEATAYFATRRFDADNCVVKPLIDAARGFLLVNDSPVYVTRVLLASKTDKANPRTELTFRPVNVVKLPEQNKKPRATANSRGHVTTPVRRM